MYFRFFYCLLFTYSGSLLAVTTQAPSELTAVPDTCVALREGRHCYADVVLSWQQPEVGNYCLRDATSKYIMQCWLKQRQGSLNYAFDSTQSISFELFDSNTSQVIAVSEVKLQGVYQNRQKKRRWRLF